MRRRRALLLIGSILAGGLAPPVSSSHGFGLAALAKPSSVDPRSQREAYARDEAGWRSSELKELQNHATNGSWEVIDREGPRAKGEFLFLEVKLSEVGILAIYFCCRNSFIFSYS